MYKRHLTKLSRTRLDDVLIDEGALDRPRVEDAQAESEMTGRPLAHILFERQEMDEWELAKIVARSYSLPFVDVLTYVTPRDAEVLLDLEFCRANLVIPFDLFGDLPAIAACEMPSPLVLEEIEERCGRPPFVYVTLRSRLLEALDNREAAGFVPATKDDVPAPRPSPLSPTAVAPVKDEAVSAPSAQLDLEPASMRLGFNMHMRGGGSRQSRPLPSPVAPPPAPRRPAPTAPVAEVVAVLTDAIDTRSQEPPSGPAEPESGESTGKAAAWQSIFDLGEDAVDS